MIWKYINLAAWGAPNLPEFEIFISIGSQLNHLEGFPTVSPSHDQCNFFSCQHIRCLRQVSSFSLLFFFFPHCCYTTKFAGEAIIRGGVLLLTMSWKKCLLTLDAVCVGAPSQLWMRTSSEMYGETLSGLSRRASFIWRAKNTGHELMSFLLSADLRGWPDSRD